MSQEAHDKIQAALTAYDKAAKNVHNFETKLREAKEAEAAALTDDDADERKVIKAVAEAQQLQTVYSRRLELARQKVSLEPLREAVLAFYWELNDKVAELMNSRRDAQFAAISARVDAAELHRSILSRGYPILFPVIGTVADHAIDVLAAQKCKPLVVWVGRPIHDATGLTLERIQEDYERLKATETAYEIERDHHYDFTPAVAEESQSSDGEPELAEQTA